MNVILALYHKVSTLWWLQYFKLMKTKIEVVLKQFKSNTTVE